MRCTINGCPNPATPSTLTCLVHARHISPEPHVEPYRGWRILAVWLGMLAFGVGFWVAAYKLFVWVLLLPTVYVSYSTGYCVRVDAPTGVYSCENMPAKYHHQWTP